MAKHKFLTSNQIEMTLEEAYNQCLEEKEARGMSKSSLANLRSSYKVFCKYHEFDSTTLLKDIKISHFYKWFNHMKNNEIRPQSINHYIRDWRAFLNWAYEREMIEEKISIKELAVQESLPKMYEDEELQMMLEKPRPGDSFTIWRDWAIISTVYATGLRASTIGALRIEDISFQRKEINIKKQKNKHAGILPLTAALANVLNEYIKKWMPKAAPDDRLFPTVTGDELHPGALNNSISVYCKRLGFKGHGIHSVRHNFSRDMILNGASEFRLQKFLQHSNIATSQHYVKLFSADLKKDAEMYSPLDNAKKKASRTSAFKKS